MGTPYVLQSVPLTITFAGSGPYTGSSAALLIALQRLPTVLVFTGRTAIANGLAQPVSARLTDVRTGQPLSGKTVTFTTGTLTTTAVTDTTGTAATTLTLPAAQSTGPANLKAAFAGDAAHLPASTTARLLIYQPSSFVIWGGNTPGLLLGQRVNFWGSQWEQQVAAGDYHARGSFKGYGTATGSPITLCEPTATTTGSPRLDAACWTSKPGNSNPPATLGDFIQVIVTTSVNKSGSTIYGNIASTVVVQVDRTSPYAPDPGHPGYGTIVAVIEDGGGLFPRTTMAAPSAPATQDLSASIGRAVAAGTHRYSLYSPELHLIAETELTTGTRPAVTNEYVWLNGHPIAQVDSTGVTNWTFTDHLGTPILQTSSAQGVTWRAEYEPFGEVYALRSYDRHQPLRLPGQEAEQLALGANGVTERSYNIHRWYRGGWGRYSQADPIGPDSQGNSFVYATDSPENQFDVNGLKALDLKPDDSACLLCSVFGEARDSTAPCQYAVAATIVNRLSIDRKKDFPVSICDIVSRKFKPKAKPQYQAFGGPSYRSCLRCRSGAPAKDDYMGFVKNFSTGFSIEHDATHHATPDQDGYFEAMGATRVSVPDCQDFHFWKVQGRHRWPEF